MQFLGSSVSKESTSSARDPDSIPGLGRSPGERNGNPLQYWCLGNLRNSRAWRATVHGVLRVRHELVTQQPAQRLLSTYSYCKIFVIVPMLYNTFLSLSHPGSLYRPLGHPHIVLRPTPHTRTHSGNHYRLFSLQPFFNQHAQDGRVEERTWVFDIVVKVPN